MNPTFKGPWPEDKRSDAIKALADVHALLTKHGLSQLIDGPKVVFRHTTCQHQNGIPTGNIGHYNPETHTIVVETKDPNDFFDTLLHEYGHAFYFKTLAPKHSLAFTQWVNKHTTPLYTKTVNYYIKTYNARNWWDLAQALGKHNKPLWHRIRWTIRHPRKLPPYAWNMANTPNLSLSEFSSYHLAPPTFEYAFCAHCLPYTYRGLHLSWEIFAETFTALLDKSHPSDDPLPKPLARYMTRLLAPYQTQLETQT